MVDVAGIDRSLPVAMACAERVFFGHHEGIVDKRSSSSREPGQYAVVHAAKRLDVLTLNLEGEPERILEQVGQVAERVKQV